MTWRKIGGGGNLPRRKYQLPLYKKLPNILFDIKDLRRNVENWSEHWKDVYDANKGLCANHLSLAENSYKCFDQIQLTTYSGRSGNGNPNPDSVKKAVGDGVISRVQDESSNPGFSSAKKSCNQLAEDTLKKFGRIGSYRAKVKDRRLIDPELDEHNWNTPCEIYKDSKIRHTIEKQFSSTPIRVRIVRLRSGYCLPPHIDYDPTYAVRVVVPIVTHRNIKNVFWKHGVKHSVHLPADGSAYFLNVGFRHGVENHSDVDRISLMFSLRSQEDIQDI